MCNANKLLLFGGIFTTPPVPRCYRITTAHVQRTLHIRWLCMYVSGARVRYVGTGPSKPQFHNDCPGSAGLANAIIIIMWTITKYHKSTKKIIFNSKYGSPSRTVDAFSVSKPPNMVVHDKNGNGVTLRRREKRPGRAKRNC